MYKDFDTMSICAQNGGNSRCRRMGSRCDMGDTDYVNTSKKHSWGLENYPLASVYAPLQNFDNLFDEETALMKGTIFTELDLPFMGESVYKGGGCRG